jgi:hypothetical protein
MIKPIKRYRAERYYMRGPGQKWIEKYGKIDQVDPVMDNRHSDKRALSGFFSQMARRWRE